MKRLLVAGLVRLYPSRWRAEYGEELAEVLLRRPLGFGCVLNVAANAGWQGSTITSSAPTSRSMGR